MDISRNDRHVSIVNGNHLISRSFEKKMLYLDLSRATFDVHDMTFVLATNYQIFD